MGVLPEMLPEMTMLVITHYGILDLLHTTFGLTQTKIPCQARDLQLFLFDLITVR